MSTSAVASQGEKTFFGHPRGLSTLFFTEMWERFSYYGMRALLVLYLVAPATGANPGFAFDDGVAKAVYGTYASLVYLTPIAGGWIADRLIGLRRSVLYGGITIAVGHFLMAIPTPSAFWLGLLAIALGTGLLKPNVSGMVGALYRGEDARRDAGFSLFYMGINIGSFAAPLVVGTLGQQYSWHLGFAVAGVGMTLGLIQYVLGRKHLAGAGELPADPATPAQRRRVALIGAGALTFLVVATWIPLLLGSSPVDAVTGSFTVLILAVPVVYFVLLLRGTQGDAAARPKVQAFVWLFLGATVFWMLFEQSGSTLTLFADTVTDLQVTQSWAMPASWLQSINPVFIVVFAPVFSAMWLRWGDRAPRTSVKFTLALVIVGISFLILIFPMGAYLADGTKATVFWLVGVYLLQTWGELLLSPNGLSATTKLAPAGATGQFLALWFLATSVGSNLGGQIARLTDGSPVATFAVCGALAVGFGLIMAVAVKRINALMGAVH